MLAVFLIFRSAPRQDFFYRVTILRGPFIGPVIGKAYPTLYKVVGNESINRLVLAPNNYPSPTLIPGYPLRRRTGPLYVLCPLKADVGEIAVTIKTDPVDADDASYMCSTNGMLQWHAQIKYGVEAAATAGKTPAVMAAHANDYVAYSTSEFKQLLTAYVNDEVRCCQDDLMASNASNPS